MFIGILLRDPARGQKTTGSHLMHFVYFCLLQRKDYFRIVFQFNFEWLLL